MKTCKHCGKIKPIEEFVKSNLTLDGTISTCKICSSERRQRKRYPVTLISKECFNCKEEKLAKEFPKNAGLEGGLHTYCKMCTNTKNKENEYYKTSREARKEKMKADLPFKKYVLNLKNENRKKNIVTQLLASAKSRATKNNLDFDLIKEDIVIPKLCPILKQPLIPGSKEDYSFSPSIDRVDNSKGYTKDNIQVISMRANKMKNDATVDEMKSFAEWVNKTFK